MSATRGRIAGWGWPSSRRRTRASSSRCGGAPAACSDVHDTASLLAASAGSAGSSAPTSCSSSCCCSPGCRCSSGSRLRPADRVAPRQRRGRAWPAARPRRARSRPATRSATASRCPPSSSRLVTGYPGVITAIAGLVAAGRRRRDVGRAPRGGGCATRPGTSSTSTRTSAVALAFSHQLATGTEFVGSPRARAYWIALYVVTLGALVVFRLGVPIARSALAPAARGAGRRGGAGRRRRSRSAAATSAGCARAPASSSRWRFLTRDRWWEAHPFSLSAAPDGRRLRITVKGVGDYTAGLRAIPPGTRVIAEGPSARSPPPRGGARASR